jgi:threonyl-tRNA synthetase
VHAYCQELASACKKAGLRVTLDDSGETLGKRIRNAEKMKIPRMVVIGDVEKQKNVLNSRDYFSGEKTEISLDAFIAEALDEIRTKKLRQIAKPLLVDAG